MRIEICAKATIHENGLYSIEFGGIGWQQVPLVPVNLKMYLFIEAQASEIPVGQHEVIIETSTTRLVGQAGFNGNGDLARWAIPFEPHIEEFGRVAISVKIGPATATTVLELRQGEATPANVLLN